MADTIMPRQLKDLPAVSEFAPLRRLAEDLEKSPKQVFAEQILDFRYGVLKEIANELKKLGPEGDIDYAEILHAWAVSQS